MGALFPEISPVLKRSVQLIETGLVAARPGLSDAQFEDYLQSAAHPESDAASASDFGDWYLRQYCLFGGILQADFIYDSSHTIFRCGGEILPWLTARDVHGQGLYDDSADAEWCADRALPASHAGDGPGALRELRRILRFREHRLHMRFVAPASLTGVVENLLDHEIVPFARNLFFHHPALGDPRRIDHLAVMNQRALAVLAEHLEQGSAVTLSHFQFQDLHIYLEMQGEHRTREILRGIIDYIHGNLKSEDTLVQLTPRSYIMISPGATQEQILDRFRNIYFQIRSVVLEYRIHLTTISEGPVQLSAVWKELKL